LSPRSFFSYAQKTEALLTNLKSVEESLKWLQQQKKKTKAEEGMSDEDKARVQIHLDIREFGEEVFLWFSL
jgi:hypothetical protein